MPPGRIVAGSIRFRGRELVGLDETAMREIRGNDISVIFQEPMTSLNPVMRVGRQIAEPLMLHQGLEPAGRLRPRRRACWISCASPTRAGASTSIRISSPAVPASAS